MPGFFLPQFLVQWPDMKRDAIQHAIETVLLTHKGQLKEFDLIKRLQSPPFEILSEKAMQGELKLFQTHFLVFHYLYKIREQWRQEKTFDLHIDALAIRVEPYQSGEEGLAVQDELARYYLNWEHWEETTQADVESLLNQFWTGFVKQQVTSEFTIEKALDILGLSEFPSSRSFLKVQYRKLIHQYHPDKGGETEQMQYLQSAYQFLLRQFVE